MIKLKLSEKVKAIQSRVRKLPELLNRILDAHRKKDALRFVEIFKAGILLDTFKLFRLQPATIAKKKAKGYPAPKKPLFGAGDTLANTLVNVFTIRKIKNGWRVSPRTAKHHEADLTLDKLLMIHEYGATIVRGDTTIVIPPRPAQRIAYEKLLKEISREDTAPPEKKAISALIKDGRTKLSSEIIKIEGLDISNITGEVASVLKDIWKRVDKEEGTTGA